MPAFIKNSGLQSRFITKIINFFCVLMAVGLVARTHATDTFCEDNGGQYSFEQKILASVDARCSQLNQLVRVDDQVMREKLLQLKAVADDIDRFTTASGLVNRLNSGHLLQKTITCADEKTLSDLQHYGSQMLTLKSSLVLVRELQTEAVKVLDLVSESLHHWIERQHHPIHYFLHKSPLKWSPFAPNQEDEIAENLKILHDKQEKFYTLLGKLSRHVESFSPTMSVAEHDAWLATFFTTARLIVPRQKKRATLAVQDDKIQQFIALAEVVSTCSYTRVIPAAIDGHFMRNWMTYCTAGVILTTGLLHVDKVQKMGEKALETGQSLLNDFCSSFWRLWDLITLEPSVTEAEVHVIVEDIPKNYDFLPTSPSKDFAMRFYDDGGVLKKDQLKEFTKDFLNNKLSSADHKAFLALQKSCEAVRINEIKQAAVDKLWLLICDNKNEKFIKELKEIVGTTRKGISSFIDDLLMGKVDNKIIPLLEVVMNNTSGVERDIPSALASWSLNPLSIASEVKILQTFFAPGANRMKNIFGYLVDGVKRGQAQLSVIIALATVVFVAGGLGVTGLIMYWLLKKSPYDFKYAREALLDVDRILNLHDNDNQTSTVGYVLNDSESGRMLYALERIKKEIVFVQEPDNWHFERDVSQLEFTSLLSIHQKRSLINIMYRQYEFLHLR